MVAAVVVAAVVEVVSRIFACVIVLDNDVQHMAEHPAGHIEYHGSLGVYLNAESYEAVDNNLIAENCFHFEIYLK